MKTIDADPTSYSQYSADSTAKDYLEGALDQEWTLNREYLGTIPDMTKAWELQNELRRQNGIEELAQEDLDLATAHMRGTP